MDILRKELDSIYAAQNLESAWLDPMLLEQAKLQAENLVAITGGCAVITDASCDRCYVFTGRLGLLMGFASQSGRMQEYDSSDEDVIYMRLHPEDLADKRMLEYEFFKKVDILQPEDKKSFKATSRLRMKDRNGAYRFIDNSTQVIELSPEGKMWLILCLYHLSPLPGDDGDINATIMNSGDGEISRLTFDNRRNRILTRREKEILLLIRDGKSSKQIAALMQISVHTVNRHRQNIIEKLSVGNSIEAITAATLMKLL